jgi:hypothetical protein
MFGFKLKPRTILWLVFTLQLVIGMALLFECAHYQQARIRLMKDQPTMQAKEEHLRTTVQNDTDIEELRARALRIVTISHNDWQRYLENFATIGNLASAAFGVFAGNAILLACTIFYTRSCNKAANQSLQTAPAMR